jgi:hypothetical protein
VHAQTGEQLPDQVRAEHILEPLSCGDVVAGERNGRA